MSKIKMLWWDTRELLVGLFLIALLAVCIGIGHVIGFILGEPKESDDE